MNLEVRARPIHWMGRALIYAPALLGVEEDGRGMLAFGALEYPVAPLAARRLASQLNALHGQSSAPRPPERSRSKRDP
ncbi:hypothetical protein BH23GEM8_BH23GEM8_09960 [soil metagenome]